MFGYILIQVWISVHCIDPIKIYIPDDPTQIPEENFCLGSGPWKLPTLSIRLHFYTNCLFLVCITHHYAGYRGRFICFKWGRNKACNIMEVPREIGASKGWWWNTATGLLAISFLEEDKMMKWWGLGVCKCMTHTHYHFTVNMGPLIIAALSNTKQV